MALGRRAVLPSGAGGLLMKVVECHACNDDAPRVVRVFLFWVRVECWVYYEDQPFCCALGPVSRTRDGAITKWNEMQWRLGRAKGSCNG